MRKSISLILSMLALAVIGVQSLSAKNYEIRTVGGCPEKVILAELDAIAVCNGDRFNVKPFNPEEKIRPDAIVAIPEPGSSDADSLLAAACACAGAKVRVLLQQSWPYSNFYTGKDYLDRYDRGQMAMFKSIASISKAACEKYGAGIIPCGAAIQSLREGVFVENVCSDGVHLNKGLGARAAACTWYRAITGKSCVGVAYKGYHLTDEMSLACEKSADAAVEKPYEISDFGFSVDWKTYNEDDVKEYVLPDALTMQDGTAVKTPEDWYRRRRPELLALFEREEFGKCPGRPDGLHFKVVKECDGAVIGRAVMKEIKIFFTEDEKHYMTLLLFLPANAEGPVPVFAGINFRGNHTVWNDPRITAPTDEELAKYANLEILPRGARAKRWPVDMLVGSGYGLATFFLGDLDPDFDDSFQNGVQPLFYRPGQDYPDPDQWGTIGAWSWGLSRVMDYLETDPAVDATKVAVIGHSRLSKTALWTAARDTRFAMAFPNNPGCSGGAISRRRFGETLSRINRHFPHWFCENYRKYNDNENALPFDQHELIALVAPRPIYIASATMDLHGDPKGEFTGTLEASKIYEFLGCKGLGVSEMPQPNTPVTDGDVAYHIRTGIHDITYYDWAQYIKFADKYFKK